MITCCPPATYLESAVTGLNPCPKDTGQIQKAIFWRQGNSLSVASALISTTWDTLFSATDDTKAIVTPFIHGFTLPLGEATEHGDTRDGAVLRKQNRSTKVEKKFIAEDQDVIRSLKKLRCEPLEVIFINEANQFIYSDREGDFRGFPIVNNSMFVSDKRIGGFSEWDYNKVVFNLEPDWSDTAEISEMTTFGLNMGIVTFVTEVLDFDGTDDMVYIPLSATAIQGTQTITFNLYLHSDPSGDECVFSFQGDTTDWLSFELDAINDVFAPKIGAAVGTWDFSAYLNQCISIQIDKSAPGGVAQIDDFKINGVSVVSVGAGSIVGNTSTKSAVGCRYLGNSTKQLFFKSGYIYNLQITGNHNWEGYPAGNTNAAWQDTIGSADGAVVGSPTTANTNCND